MGHQKRGKQTRGVAGPFANHLFPDNLMGWLLVFGLPLELFPDLLFEEESKIRNDSGGRDLVPVTIASARLLMTPKAMVTLFNGDGW